MYAEAIGSQHKTLKRIFKHLRNMAKISPSERVRERLIRSSAAMMKFVE
jgi:hypothetical protein